MLINCHRKIRCSILSMLVCMRTYIVTNNDQAKATVTAYNENTRDA